MPKPKPQPTPFRKTLISAEKSIRVDAWNASQRDLKIRGMKPWSVRKLTLHGGRQEGVDLIEVDNGVLRFTVIPTRGMAVLKVESGDLRLGWDSPVREVVHPQYVNLNARNGLGWLEGFNEWLVRCGLESFGPPCKDADTGSDLTLHGKVTNIPASEVEVVIDRVPPYRIRIRGRVDERCMFGPKLELWTEISTEPGSAAFRVEDQVANRGGSEQEFQLLYHVNFGAPLLEGGARFIGAMRTVTPATPWAAKGLGTYDLYSAPEAGFAEQVYLMEPFADAENRTQVMLQNAAGNRAVSMAFSLAQLPFFSLWKNTGAVEDGYVTGLEPGTGFPRPRHLERQAGRVPKLAPGADRRFAIDFAVHADKSEVTRAAARIEALKR